MNAVFVAVISSVLHILAAAVWPVSLPLLSLGTDYDAISNFFFRHWKSMVAQCSQGVTRCCNSCQKFSQEQGQSSSTHTEGRI